MAWSRSWLLFRQGLSFKEKADISHCLFSSLVLCCVLGIPWLIGLLDRPSQASASLEVFTKLQIYSSFLLFLVAGCLRTQISPGLSLRSSSSLVVVLKCPRGAPELMVATESVELIMGKVKWPSSLVDTRAEMLEYNPFWLSWSSNSKQPSPARA